MFAFFHLKNVYQSFIFHSFYIYWLFYLFAFQILSPFPVSPPQALYLLLPPPATEGSPQPAYPLLPQCPSIPLCWIIKLPQDQGAPFPVMPAKPILCYISSWSHGFLYVYSLVGGLVPVSFGGSGWLILEFFLWYCKPL